MSGLDLGEQGRVGTGPHWGHTDSEVKTFQHLLHIEQAKQSPSGVRLGGYLQPFKAIGCFLSTYCVPGAVWDAG